MTTQVFFSDLRLNIICMLCLIEVEDNVGIFLLLSEAQNICKEVLLAC